MKVYDLSNIISEKIKLSSIFFARFCVIVIDKNLIAAQTNLYHHQKIHKKIISVLLTYLSCLFSMTNGTHRLKALAPILFSFSQTPK